MTQPINPRIAACIPLLLAKLPVQAADKFRQSFETQDSRQSEHTFRELVLGAWLADLALKIEHERKMDNGQTPDWTLLDAQDKPVGIIEATTVRQEPGTEAIIEAALDDGEAWCGFPPEAAPRIHRSIKRKVEKYRALTTAAALPYVVAIFGHSYVFIEEEDLRSALFNLEGGGVFASSPALSGVLFFENKNGKDSFRYCPNPAARFPMPFLEEAT